MGFYEFQHAPVSVHPLSPLAAGQCHQPRHFFARPRVTKAEHTGGHGAGRQARGEGLQGGAGGGSAGERSVAPRQSARREVPAARAGVGVLQKRKPFPRLTLSRELLKEAGRRERLFAVTPPQPQPWPALV